MVEEGALAPVSRPHDGSLRPGGLETVASATSSTTVRFGGGRTVVAERNLLGHTVRFGGGPTVVAERDLLDHRQHTVVEEGALAPVSRPPDPRLRSGGLETVASATSSTTVRFGGGHTVVAERNLDHRGAVGSGARRRRAVLSRTPIKSRGVVEVAAREGLCSSCCC